MILIGMTIPDKNSYYKRFEINNITNVKLYKLIVYFI